MQVTAQNSTVHHMQEITSTSVPCSAPRKQFEKQKASSNKVVTSNSATKRGQAKLNSGMDRAEYELLADRPHFISAPAFPGCVAVLFLDGILGFVPGDRVGVRGMDVGGWR